MHSRVELLIPPPQLLEQAAKGDQDPQPPFTRGRERRVTHWPRKHHWKESKLGLHVPRVTGKRCLTSNFSQCTTQSNIVFDKRTTVFDRLARPKEYDKMKNTKNFINYLICVTFCSFSRCHVVCRTSWKTVWVDHATFSLAIKLCTIWFLKNQVQ